MFDIIFYWCVDILKVYSAKLGMTYEELNVWLFVIIYPILFILLLGYGINYHYKYYKLKMKNQ